MSTVSLVPLITLLSSSDLVCIEVAKDLLNLGHVHLWTYHQNHYLGNDGNWQGRKLVSNAATALIASVNLPELPIPPAPICTKIKNR